MIPSPQVSNNYLQNSTNYLFAAVVIFPTTIDAVIIN